ncbi:MAG: hypothetical protein Q9190_000676 [Brigantiaea leucoxantha]
MASALMLEEKADDFLSTITFGAGNLARGADCGITESLSANTEPKQVIERDGVRWLSLLLANMLPNN